MFFWGGRGAPAGTDFHPFYFQDLLRAQETLLNTEWEEI